MKFIAWDTSSKTGALVAFEAGPHPSFRLATELTMNVDSTHSERLLWGIHQVLESARWRLDEVDFFGVGTGPGSFTGLRIGVTTARTLAQALKKPLLGVSSLAALARPCAVTFSQAWVKHPTWVIAVTDACKGELFCLRGEASQVALCSSSESGSALWQEAVLEEVIQPELLVDEIRKKLTQNPLLHWVVVGEGRQRYSEVWNSLPLDRELTVQGGNGVQGRFLAQLVWEAFLAGDGQDQSPLRVYPRYLRAADAEIKLRAGLLPPSPQRTGL